MEHVVASHHRYQLGGVCIRPNRYAVKCESYVNVSAVQGRWRLTGPAEIVSAKSITFFAFDLRSTTEDHADFQRIRSQHVKLWINVDGAFHQSAEK